MGPYNQPQPVPSASARGRALINLAHTLVGAGRELHSHARAGPALELTPAPLSLIARHTGASGRLPWPARRAWERQGVGQGLSPSLHCPLLELELPLPAL